MTRHGVRVRPIAAATPQRRERVVVVSTPVLRLTSDEPGVIRTERLVLRPLVSGDRERFLEVLGESREHLSPWMPLNREGESDEAVFERHVRSCAEGDAKGTSCRRGVFLHDGSFAGCFNLLRITRGLTNQAELSGWLGRGKTGCGLATEALAGLCAYALEDQPRGLGLQRLEAYASRANGPSLGLIRRLGFTRASEQHTYLSLNDRWELHDLYVYELGPAASTL